MIVVRNCLAAALSLVLLPLFPAGQSPLGPSDRTGPLGPSDRTGSAATFTVAVNTSTIEAGPVYVAKAGPRVRASRS